jgi:predicted GIY-YIG superfamily endonuclease
MPKSSRSKKRLVEKSIKPVLADPLKTATAKKIIAAIEAHINQHSFISPDASRWYCGVTATPEKRQSQHQRNFANLKFFQAYYAYSKRIAIAIEKFISERGTANAIQAGNATEKSRYIYVFKAHPIW